MVKRFYICKGDTTTAGGTVLESSSVMHCDGRPLAFEGDAVACPACNSTGRIVCEGARWPMSGPDGRQAALDDDICLCRCNPLPRLIASQRMMAMTMDELPADSAVQRATAHVYATSAAPVVARHGTESEHSASLTAAPFGYTDGPTRKGEALELAARGVSEEDEAECHAQYEMDMETCNAARAMYRSPAYFLACSQKAFERYQQCRGY
ncbi:PAAR domain-containing protein [bacterium M00.F.Ca.ET.228.01.1.1]|nr:PAAR domain-containing protein [bacterium M00.F.Ca.ET.228.01.1.1]TGR96536.1 PAAR domain-containing protein [bacterium M00.F.Ca.ET.191.01.1.1]TGT97772.1 PAAR domain-containing protein [bacterium M00.F.Ca.ET.155.01.1.1]